METINIAIPDSLRDFVEERVAGGKFSSINEYLEELVRADKKRCAKQVLEAEVIRGLNSGDSVPMTDDDWNRLRNEVRERANSPTSNRT